MQQGLKSNIFKLMIFNRILRKTKMVKLKTSLTSCILNICKLHSLLIFKYF